MGTATYRLNEYVRFNRYAVVTATADFAPATTMVVSARAFDWLRTVYGPDAGIDGPGLEEFRQAARDGALYALQHIAGREGELTARVVIDEIRFTNTDTLAEDVRRAACFAVWQALDVQGVHPPVRPMT